jgi:hypothetical protein
MTASAESDISSAESADLLRIRMEEVLEYSQRFPFETYIFEGQQHT